MTNGYADAVTLRVQQRLECEMADARRYVRRCRESGDEQAAQLHVVWIDLLLEEWQRCRQSRG